MKRDLSNEALAELIVGCMSEEYDEDLGNNYHQSRHPNLPKYQIDGNILYLGGGDSFYAYPIDLAKFRQKFELG